MESLKLPSGGEGGGWDACPTEVDITEAASLQDNRSEDLGVTVEAVEHVGIAPRSSTSDDLCSDVSQMCSDLPSIDSMFIQSLFQDTSVYAILFQKAGQVPKGSLNLPTGGEDGGGNKIKASLYGDRDDHLDVVKVVKCVGRAPGSPTMTELCSNVSKMWFDSSP